MLRHDDTDRDRFARTVITLTALEVLLVLVAVLTLFHSDWLNTPGLTGPLLALTIILAASLPLILVGLWQRDDMAGARHRVRVVARQGYVLLDERWYLFRIQRAGPVFARLRGREWEGADQLTAAYARRREHRQRVWDREDERRNADNRALPDELTRAYQTLYLQSDAPVAVGEAAYRALMKSAHPDTRGDETYARDLVWAITVIRSHADATAATSADAVSDTTTMR